MRSVNRNIGQKLIIIVLLFFRLLSINSLLMAQESALSTPQNLIALPYDGMVYLRWNKVPETDILRYNIYAGASSYSMTLIDSTTGGVNDTVKVIKGLTNGATYYFKVTSVDINGEESDFSNVTSATPREGPLWSIPSTGLPYHIVVTNVTVDGKLLPAGSEIGVFDGDSCVGSIVVENYGQTNIDIVAWEGKEEYNLHGFKRGNNISFQIWAKIYNEWQLLEAKPSYVVGDGTFGYGTYTSASLKANSYFRPEISLLQTLIDFGNVYVGKPSSQKLTILNIGNARLSIHSINTDNPSFSVVGYPEYIEPGQSGEVNIEFYPTSAKLTQAYLIIKSDDPENPEVKVYMSGQAIAEPQAIIQVIPDSIDFGYVPIGEIGTKNILIRNVGNQTLTASSVYSDNSRFIPLESNFVVDVNGSYNLPIDFTPTTEGLTTGSIYIQSNAANNSNYQIYVSGYSYPIHFSPVEPTGLPYTIIIDSATVDNHDLSAGDQIAVFDGDLCVGMVVFQSYPIQITVWESDETRGMDGFTPGNPINIKLWVTTYGQRVELTPQITWKKGNGVFGEGEYSVCKISAYSGLEPKIILNKSFINFFAVKIGDRSTASFFIKNAGKTNLEVTTISINNDAFKADSTGFSVSPGDSQRVSITFEPLNALPYNAILQVFSNDPYTPVAEIELHAQGLPGDTYSIGASSTRLKFPPTKIGSSSTSNITIINNGTGTINISGISFSDPSFSTSINSFDIESGGSYNLPVVFTPNRIDSINGFMVLYNNSGNAPSLTIDLSGIGYEGYFNSIEPTGLPFTIIINQVDTNSIASLNIGSEIGIFDGQLCVGVGVVESDTGNVVITAWQSDTTHGLAGFRIGQPIKVRYYTKISGAEHLYATTITPVEGEAKFGNAPYIVLNVKIDHEIPPANPPQNIVVQPSLQGIQLEWDPYQENNIIKTYIYRSTLSGFTLTEENLLTILEPVDTTFVDTAVVNGQNYYYAIMALDSIGRFSSPFYIGPIKAIKVDVWDVTFEQRKDGSAIVDIYYSFSGEDTVHYNIKPYLSIDGGETWQEITMTSGDVGAVTPGINRHLIWNFGEEMPNEYYKNVKIKVTILAP